MDKKIKLILNDGVAIIDFEDLVMGDDNTCIGYFYHQDYPTTPQAIKRLSVTGQIILRTLLNKEA